VQYLANLGGLVAAAGLDHQPPDLLLGALLELAARLLRLSAERKPGCGRSIGPGSPSAPPTSTRSPTTAPTPLTTGRRPPRQLPGRGSRARAGRRSSSPVPLGEAGHG